MMIFSKIFNVKGLSELAFPKSGDSQGLYLKLHWFNRGSYDQLTVEELKQVKKTLQAEYKKSLVNLDKKIKEKSHLKTA